MIDAILHTLRQIVSDTNKQHSTLRCRDHYRADIGHSIMIYHLQNNQERPNIRFSNSSGLKVDLLLLPFSFFVTALFEVLFRDRYSSRLFASSASASASSNFCWTVRAGDKTAGCVCVIRNVKSWDRGLGKEAYLKGNA